MPVSFRACSAFSLISSRRLSGLFFASGAPPSPDFSTLRSPLLFLLVKGDSFTSPEITEVFFGVTKLFQSTDMNLRRMMYLFIKEIAETCNKDDVIIVTSSLTKDMNTGEDLYRANSMRVLAKIIDATMLGAIERYIKQAIIDRNPFVASSALTAGTDHQPSRLPTPTPIPSRCLTDPCVTEPLVNWADHIVRSGSAPLVSN